VRSTLKLLLGTIGSKGILACLGYRSTVRSIAKLLPSKVNLVEAFNQMHGAVEAEPSRKSVKLSVGARALAKHAIRSSEVVSVLGSFGGAV
jgi:hypothetical protein